ncbi:MAG: hypothetical protein ABIN25_01775 [Ginsengibacter sp.]
MKKVSSMGVALIFIAIFIQSCTKQSINDEVRPNLTNIINTTIAPNKDYNITINEPGEVYIVKQAKHYKLSEIISESNAGQKIYTYMPAQDYTGAEEIILGNKKSGIVISGGCSSDHAENSSTSSFTTTYTMIRITIGN